MAGRFAPIYSSIWSDADFVALSVNAQRLYLLALSQPNISFAGVVPYTEKRWAGMAADSTRGSIADAVNELEDARFVFLDAETEELMVRSFVKNAKIYEQPQLRNALVKAYEGILSTGLRRKFYAEQTEVVKVLVGSPPPASEEPGASLPEPLAAATVTKDLDLDLELHQQPGEAPCGQRPSQAHSLLRDQTPPLRAEVDETVAALTDVYATAAVDGAVRNLLDEGRKFQWPSQVRSALTAVLGPAPAQAQASPFDDGQRAARQLEERGHAQMAELATVPIDPALNAKGIAETRAALRANRGGGSAA